MTVNVPVPSMKNWKTTLAGLAGYAMVFVQVMSEYHASGIGTALKDPRIWMGFLVSSGLLAAKDSNVTGGTSGQPSTPQALSDASQAPAVGVAAPVGPEAVAKPSA